MRLMTKFAALFSRRAFLTLTLAGLAFPAVALDAPPTVARPAKVTVFAAASLRNALDNAAALWKRKTGGAAAIAYAASFPLARQIAAGAPADIYIGADVESMDYLAAKKLIVAKTRKNLLGNDLVLIAPKSARENSVALTPAAIAATLAGGRMAMGDPVSVPAGIYGKAALKKLGLWKGAKNHLALADNVRSALLYVSRAETPLGIVYGTDAHAAPEVKIVARFPADSHPPIVYPIAMIAGSKNPAAKKFLAFLEGPEAARAFVAQGFVVLGGK